MQHVVIESNVLEEWLRTTFVDDDGQIFLPCGAFGDELQALLSLTHDGVPIVQHQRHIYAPASWLAKEHARHASTINAIVEGAKKRMKEVGIL